MGAIKQRVVKGSCEQLVRGGDSVPEKQHARVGQLLVGWLVLSGAALASGFSSGLDVLGSSLGAFGLGLSGWFFRDSHGLVGCLCVCGSGGRTAGGAGVNVSGGGASDAVHAGSRCRRGVRVFSDLGPGIVKRKVGVRLV